jgi:hypothetical protein
MDSYEALIYKAEMTLDSPHVISEKQTELVKIFRPLKIIYRKKKRQRNSRKESFGTTI